MSQSGNSSVLDRVVAGFVRAGVTGRRVVIGIPLIWLTLFFLLPFLIVLKISFASQIVGIPPFSPLFDWSAGGFPKLQLDFSNYDYLFSDDLYIVAYLNSVKIAFFSTCICTLIAYPMAYGVARAPESWRNPLLLLIVLPFWTSLLLRVYAWIGLLKGNGIINNFLISIGLITDPLPMMNNAFSVYVGIVYSYLPFMLLPLYASLSRLDLTLLEAAADLGASRTRAFLSVTLPLSLPGVIAGGMLVFIPAIGEFVIPSLLGGPGTTMIGRVIWDEFFENQAWPVASAVAIALMLFLVVPIMIFQYYQARSEEQI
ncbi:MAG: ABC transporter permease subunit [Parvibaculum sp.]|jgi:putrescine transport system permease protein|uniref:ABC transporter permease subunit n=1 Tax=Parvibaculum sp. TaxID=2024848 RepID=UPI00283E02A1|nr:ABC transporter permease subunit [Parvibaculum sp.]MDR3499729.1 ABC transporter permease subunit [Parvibaculum sp.]